MANYVILSPTRLQGTEYLHRETCRFYHRRTTRTNVLVRAKVEPNDSFLQELHLCGECLPDGIPADLRADLWMQRIHIDHNRLKEVRAENARQQRREAAKADFLAQFEDLRRSCEYIWGRPVTFRSYTSEGNLALSFDGDRFHDVLTVYLTAEDGEHGVRYEGCNHSTGLVRTMEDAEAVGLVFTLLKNWRRSAPLVVPAGAPDFYGIR